ncbi:hypothetical protein OG21DRAFT_1501672 [Imleria badia]|nr:hypothetical protein OG21DRAFT_1501672 [Imleria badia]
MEINAGRRTIWAVAFSANGEYLVSGGFEGVRVWRVSDGKETATIAPGSGGVRCLAASKDGRWMAAGTLRGEVIVWDGETYQHTATLKEGGEIGSVDFSPDSTRLVAGASVWDIAGSQRVLTLGYHRGHDCVAAAKYAPQGDRIATATPHSVRVWDSNEGRLLVEINVKVTPWLNTGLLWSGQQLFIVSDGKIKQFDAYTGSPISESVVFDNNSYPCMALSQHGAFIAHSAGKRTVTFWDTATNTQLELIQHPRDIRSVVLSPHDQFLAIAGEGGKITIKSLSAVREPHLQIDDMVLDSWKCDQLLTAEALLTAAILKSRDPSSHVLAGRALVKGRLRKWDAALADAKQSIKIRPSIFGYIAKSVALVGKGKTHDGYRACDIAFEHFHSTHVSFLLLIKAIIVFMAGEHKDAIARVDDLIATVPWSPECYVVQAQMYLLFGNWHMERSEYEDAIQSFKHAQAQMRHHGGQLLLVISLISGWKFDDLGITVQQRLCEALYAAGRTKEAGEFLLEMLNAVDEEGYISGPIATWVSDFAQQCLSTPESSDDAISMAPRDGTRSPFLTPLLSLWAKLKLTSSPWKDALVAAAGFTIPRFISYRAICERLETINHITDVIECLQHMQNELGEEADMSDEQAKWVVDFKQRCAESSERLGDAAADAQRYDDAIALYSAALSLDLAVPQVILIKRSKVYIAKERWEDALDDTNQVTILDPSSPFCSERVLMEWATVTLTDGSWRDALTTAGGFRVTRFAIYRALCERLHAVGRVMDAIECVYQMVDELGDTETHDEQAVWAADFEQRCAESSERLGDAVANAQRYDDAITLYSAALSLNLASPQDILIKRSKVYMAKGLWEDALDDTSRVITLDTSSPWGYKRVLTEWAKVILTDGSWKNALTTAQNFKVPRFTVYRALCERLEAADRVMAATECFYELASRFARELDGEQTKWILSFTSRCCGKLEDLGDTTMATRQYDEAISQYSAALSLNPAQVLFVKRSKAYAEKGLWEDALNDANMVITLDPSSPFGYEGKYVALRGAGRHMDTLHAFEMMLSMMLRSPDPEIRERHRHYTKTRQDIRIAVKHAIRESPRVLINTVSGRLCNKSEQGAAFELLPVFTELISSMTGDIDHARIKQEVTKYYRYAMFSHKWDDNEPLFDKCRHFVVYELEESPTHDKLQMFCKIVREAGFHWAWSDTCCINKGDQVVLQEALVTMFKWYRGSAVTIVFLRGVRSPSKRGDLVASIWNTRAWTFQEYHAAKVVRFYTEDWTPYLNLDMYNHKESSEVISEMEAATGVSARALVALQPGLGDIREKLRLASTRETSRIEDVAYSLLGIFSVTGIPVIYGEGESALGRLLAHILSGSGDTSILAWTGESGSYNSCLPGRIAVFDGPSTSHLPLPIEDTKLEQMVATLRTSSLDLDAAVRLYDRLDELPAPEFAATRLKLPCISFKLPPLSVHKTSSGRVYRVETPTFGMVKIKIGEEARLGKSLYLVHPWLDTLLDCDETQSTSYGFVEGEEDEDEESDNDDDDEQSDTSQDEDIQDEETLDDDDASSPSERESVSPHASPTWSTVPAVDRETRALRLIARLRQPFGALLLRREPFLARRRTTYRRVAADSMIRVQMRENVSLAELHRNVRVIDVL